MRKDKNNKGRDNANKAKAAADKKASLNETNAPAGKDRTNESSTTAKTPPRVFYAILLLIPILFFVLFEVSLRLFNYGINTDQWIDASAGKIILNPEVSFRYFNTITNKPYSIQDVFDREKKPNAFRVFVLGESSAAGFPYMPLGSFSRYLKRRLEVVYPASTIEVVNVSMTAINSYALRDMMPGILEQKPDLILIYTGHNEYYGALGIGSMESLGSNRRLVNFILYLNRFKTVEFLRNTIAKIASSFAGESDANRTGTLMARIAKEQYIAMNSDIYKKGLEQFEGNMRDILEMSREKGVPIIMGTVASNLKDQYPFISVKASGMPAAEEVFKKAKQKYAEGKYEEALKLFREARDLDALRFRAPEALNKMIFRLGKEFNAPVADMDALLNSMSPGGITGDNLMTDHLHPTLQGYLSIGRLFFETMMKNGFVPKTAPAVKDLKSQDSLALARFNFSHLDSVMAEYKIVSLKNDWPFISKEGKKPFMALVKPEDFYDSLAVKVTLDQMTWEKAHRIAAAYSIRHNDLKGFLEHFDILISQYPVITEYYDFAANELLKRQLFDQAYKYFRARYDIRPSALSAKWIGIVALSKSRLDEAVKFLEVSRQMAANDTQVLYNLAGAYALKKDYDKALRTIDECLRLDPQYPQAGSLKMQLTRALGK